MTEQIRPEPPGGVSDHAALSNVTSDQHHAQAHSLTSHSTRAHSELTGIGATDHHSNANDHAQAHTLTSHSTRAHSELTGVGADDHHAQSHTLTSHSTRAHSELTGIGTDDHHAQAHTHSVIFNVGGVLLSPTGAINVIVWYVPFACTVTNVRGYRVGGTGATINARKNGSSNHLASALSLTSADAWMDGGSVQNTAYVATDKLEIMVVSVAGSPTQIAVQVDLTRTV